MMKKLISFIMVIAMMASVLVLGTSAKAGDNDTWDGTADTSWYDPTKVAFEISTAEQLAGVAALSAEGVEFNGVTLLLTADIVLNSGDAKIWDAIAPNNVWKTPIGKKAAPFRGIFDGQGHTVSGIYMSEAGNRDCYNIGLFGYVGGENDYAVVKNLKVINSYMVAFGKAGLIIGRMGENSKIENCSAEGTVIAIEEYPSTSGLFGANSHTGGVVGIIENAYEVFVERCRFSGYVEGFCRTGAIVGSSSGSIITVNDCYSDAKVVGKNRIGGIFGHSNASIVEMTNCVFTGEINHSVYAKNYGAIMGGFRAQPASELIITDCYYDAVFKTIDAGTGEYTVDLPARVAVTEIGFLGEGSAWYTPMEDASNEPSGNDADGCEVEVTKAGAGAKEEFVTKLNPDIWDVATLTLKAIEINEQNVSAIVPEVTQAPETTKASETTKTPDSIQTPETTKAPEVTKAPETTKTPDAHAEGGCGAVIGGSVVVGVAILGSAWVSKRR